MHRIVLGGIGADAHSVGLFVLRHALTESGYQVIDLRTQNELRDFFEAARTADVVMISSMDGHSRFYTREFLELRKEYGTLDAHWYIGGNLSVSSSPDEVARHFRELGFRRVFPGYADLRQVLRNLEHDLAGRRPAALTAQDGRTPATRSRTLVLPEDQRMEDEHFRIARKEVLQHWRTGRDAADLDANAEFLGGRPLLAAAQLRARHTGRPLLQPRCGVADAIGQAALFSALHRAGANVLSYQVDSLSRNNDYSGAEEGLRASSPDRSVLNGFPVVNHGVRALRQLAARTPTPLQTRHSTRDPRLLGEISYAGGVTAFEGGAITYNLPYYKDYPLEESIPVWQYVDRLTGLYAERYGIILDREFFGVLTATLLPPCLAIVTTLLEMLMAVGQGVRSVSLGYAEQGCRSQDVAAIQVMDEMADELVGHARHGVLVTTVFHQYMAAFPEARQKALALIRGSARTAALSGCGRVLLKTTAEAWGIPTVTENADAIRQARRSVDAATPADLDPAAVDMEKRLLRAECDHLLNAVLECGGGSVTKGVVRAFRLGLLDIPFAPSVHNRGEVLGIRDTGGAVRLLAPGRLPLPADIREFHRDRIQERLSKDRGQSRRTAAEMAAFDIRRVIEGDFDDWPLS
ncbi:methylaspartate mutase subunit E [Streptomyces sp. N50]|uniref:methylaspartate mutase subunit E n=1 Tax=Streptomyces sp. N50 TaxID=3081765 RepID=UPI002962018F|nr:methylaspartate mutase subunit E [Streptomyces sp. N50]WOX17144.1 methylaspartate mutase subunit E [Streptomyces sp. N50]